MSKISKKGMYTIVLEDIRAKFDFLADGLKTVNDKLDRNFKESDEKVDQGFEEMNLRFSRLDSELLAVRVDLSDMKKVQNLHSKQLQSRKTEH